MGCMFEKDQLNNVGDIFQHWLNEILLGEEAGSPRLPSHLDLYAIFLH